MSVIIQPWHKNVSGGYEALDIEIKNGGIKICNEINLYQDVAGWFGFFDGEIFAVFKSEVHTDGFLILLRDEVFPLKKVVAMRRDNAALRKNVVFYFEKGWLNFSYRKFWWTFIYDIKSIPDLLCDDWWGLECDLPAYVADNFSSEVGEFFDDVLLQWNNRSKIIDC